MRDNYTIQLFLNGKDAGMCIDWNHAMRDLKAMLEFFVDDYHFPVTIVDASNRR